MDNQQQVVLDFFHSLGDQNNLEDLFNQSFHPHATQTGSFGCKVGIDEVKWHYNFRHEIFSARGLKFLKLQSCQNFVDYEVLFYERHDRELSQNTKEIILSTHTSPFVQLMANTPSTGIKTVIDVQGTFVFHQEKVSFFNLHVDTSSFVHQLFPKTNLPTPPYEKVTSKDLLQMIQQTTSFNLTPIETAILAFSIGGFNPKQSSIYLLQPPEAIEKHLFSCYKKLGYFNEVECREKMSEKGHEICFKNLCHSLITSPIAKIE